MHCVLHLIAIWVFNIQVCSPILFNHSDGELFLHVSNCDRRLSMLQPPLVQAIFNGDPDEVRSLIFKKEDVNVQVRDGFLEVILVIFFFSLYMS